MVADDRRGRLLGLVLPLGLGAHLDADAVGLEELGHLGVVLQVRAGGITPGVAAAAVLLAEEAGEGRAVFGREAPFLPYAPVPVLGQGLGHLDPEPVQQEVLLVAVLGEEPGRLLGT